jgi:hypothetical protein
MERKMSEKTDDKKINVNLNTANLIRQLSYVMTKDMTDNQILVKQILKIARTDTINILSLHEPKNQELLDDIITCMLQTESVKGQTWLAMAIIKGKKNTNQLVIHHFDTTRINKSKLIENNLNQSNILDRYSHLECRTLKVEQFQYPVITNITEILEKLSNIKQQIINNVTYPSDYYAIQIAQKNTEYQNQFTSKVENQFKQLYKEKQSSSAIIKILYDNNKTITHKKKLLTMKTTENIDKVLASFKDYSTSLGEFENSVKEYKAASDVLRKTQNLDKNQCDDAIQSLHNMQDTMKGMCVGSLALIEELKSDKAMLQQLATTFEQQIQAEKEAKALEEQQNALNTQKIQSIPETIQKDEKITVEQQSINTNKRYNQEERKEEKTVNKDVAINLKIAEGKNIQLEFKNNKLEGFPENVFASEIDNLRSNIKAYVVCKNDEQYQEFFKEMKSANIILSEKSKGDSGFKIANDDTAYFKITRKKSNLVDTEERLSFEIKYVNVSNETVMIFTNPKIVTKDITDNIWEAPKSTTKTIKTKPKQK